MSYIQEKNRLFLRLSCPEEESRQLQRKRSEGRLKTYASCTDARAWSLVPWDRRNHLLELINRQARGDAEYGDSGVMDQILAEKNAIIDRLTQRLNELEAAMQTMQNSMISGRSSQVATMPTMPTSMISGRSSEEETMRTMQPSETSGESLEGASDITESGTSEGQYVTGSEKATSLARSFSPHISSEEETEGEEEDEMNLEDLIIRKDAQIIHLKSMLAAKAAELEEREEFLFECLRKLEDVNRAVESQTDLQDQLDLSAERIHTLMKEKNKLELEKEEALQLVKGQEKRIPTNVLDKEKETKVTTMTEETEPSRGTSAMDELCEALNQITTELENDESVNRCICRLRGICTQLTELSKEWDTLNSQLVDVHSKANDLIETALADEDIKDERNERYDNFAIASIHFKNDIAEMTVTEEKLKAMRMEGVMDDSEETDESWELRNRVIELEMQIKMMESGYGPTNTGDTTCKEEEDDECTCPEETGEPGETSEESEWVRKRIDRYTDLDERVKNMKDKAKEVEALNNRIAELEEMLKEKEEKEEWFLAQEGEGRAIPTDQLESVGREIPADQLESVGREIPADQLQSVGREIPAEQLQSLEKERDNLLMELEAVKRDAESMMMEIEQLRRQLAQLEAEHLQTLDHLQSCEDTAAECDMFKNQCMNLETEVSDLREQIALLEEKARERDTLLNRIHELQCVIEDQEDETKRMLVQLERLACAADREKDLERQLMEQAADLQSQEDEIMQLLKKLEEISGGEAGDREGAITEDVLDLQQQILDLMEELAKEKQSSDRLRSQLNQSKKQLAFSTLSLQSLSPSDLRDLFSQARSALSIVMLEMKDHTITLQGLLEKNRRLQEENDILKGLIDGGEANRQLLPSISSENDQSAIMEEQAKRIKELEKENSELVEKIKQLSTGAADVTPGIETSVLEEKQVSSTEQAEIIKELEKENSELKEQIKQLSTVEKENSELKEQIKQLSTGSGSSDVTTERKEMSPMMEEQTEKIKELEEEISRLTEQIKECICGMVSPSQEEEVIEQTAECTCGTDPATQMDTGSTHGEAGQETTELTEEQYEKLGDDDTIALKKELETVKAELQKEIELREQLECALNKMKVVEEEGGAKGTDVEEVMEQTPSIKDADTGSTHGEAGQETTELTEEQYEKLGDDDIIALKKELETVKAELQKEIELREQIECALNKMKAVEEKGSAKGIDLEEVMEQTPTSVKDADSEIMLLKEQLATSEQQKEQLQKILNDLSKQLDEQKDQLRQLSEIKCPDLEGKSLEIVKEDLYLLQAQLQAAVLENQELRAFNDNLRALIESSKQEAASSVNIMEETQLLETQYRASKLENERLWKFIEKLKNEMDDQNTKLMQSVDQLTTIEQEDNQLQEEINNLINQLKSVVEENKMLRNYMNKQETEGVSMSTDSGGVSTDTNRPTVSEQTKRSMEYQQDGNREDLVSNLEELAKQQNLELQFLQKQVSECEIIPLKKENFELRELINQMQQEINALQEMLGKSGGICETNIPSGMTHMAEQDSHVPSDFLPALNQILKKIDELENNMATLTNTVLSLKASSDVTKSREETRVLEKETIKQQIPAECSIESVESMKAEINNLKKENEELKKQLQQVISAEGADKGSCGAAIIQQKEEMEQSLRQQISNLMEENQKLKMAKEISSDGTDEIKSLKAEIDQLKKENEQLRKTSGEGTCTEAIPSEMEQSLRQQISNLMEENEKLKMGKEIPSDGADEIMSLKTEIDQLKKENEQLRKLSDEATRTETIPSEMEQSLRQQISNLMEENEKLKMGKEIPSDGSDEIKSLKAEIDQLKKENEQLRKASDESTHSEAIPSEMEQNLRQQISDLTKENQKLKMEKEVLSDGTDEINGLKAEIALLRNENQRLRKGSKEDIDTIPSDVAIWEVKEEQLQSLVGEQKKRLDDLLAKKGVKGHGTAAAWEKEREYLLDKIRQLSEGPEEPEILLQKKEMEDTIDSLTSQLEALKKKCEEENAGNLDELNALREENAKLKSKLLSAQTDLESVKWKLGEQSEQLRGQDANMFEENDKLKKELAALQAQLEQAGARALAEGSDVQQLMLEIEALKKENSDLRDELAALQAQLEQAGARALTEGSDVQQLMLEIEALKKENSDLRDQLAALQAQLEQAGARALGEGSDAQQLSLENEAFRNENSDLRDKLAALQAQLEQTRGQAAGEMSDVQRLSLEIEALRKENSDLRDSIDALNSIVESLKKLLGEGERQPPPVIEGAGGDRVSELEAELAALKAKHLEEIRRLEQENRDNLETYQRELKELKEAEEKKYKELQSKLDEGDSMKQSAANYENEIADLRNQRDMLVKNMQAEIDAKNAELENLNFEITKLQKELSKCSSECSKLKSDLEQSISESEKLKQLTESLRAELEDSKYESEKLKQAEDELKRLKAELEASKSESQKLKQQAESLRAELEDSKSEAQMLKQQAESLRAELEDSKSEAQKLKQQAESLRAELEDSKSESQKLKQQAESLRAELEDSKSESQKLKQQAESLRAQLEDSKSEAQKLKQQAESLRAELEDSKSESEKFKKQAESELKRLKAELGESNAESAKLKKQTDDELNRLRAEKERLKSEPEKQKTVQKRKLDEEKPVKAPKEKPVKEKAPVKEEPKPVKKTTKTETKPETKAVAKPEVKQTAAEDDSGICNCIEQPLLRIVYKVLQNGVQGLSCEEMRYVHQRLCPHCQSELSTQYVDSGARRIQETQLVNRLQSTEREIIERQGKAFRRVAELEKSMIEEKQRVELLHRTLCDEYQRRYDAEGQMKAMSNRNQDCVQYLRQMLQDERTRVQKLESELRSQRDIISIQRMQLEQDRKFSTRQVNESSPPRPETFVCQCTMRHAGQSC